ncbi:MAG TPA: hypothetical protein VIL32_13485 [Steroidobacteraceae bacterium]
MSCQWKRLARARSLEPAHDFQAAGVAGSRQCLQADFRRADID